MTQPAPAPTTDPTGGKEPWPALFALCIGFFMILVDTTIVSVATPAIIEDLDAGVNDVVWVTSAYLLAYAVPVLITGRLGDRFGPKNVYLIGLTVFTLASLWCGLTGSIEMLIAARVVQGLGASMITPADDGDHHPDLPGRPPRRRDVAVGCDRRRRDAGRPDPRRHAGRRPRLGVDLLHQHPDRRGRLRAGDALVPKLPTHSHSSTGSASRSAGSACSCWCSASRRVTSTTGAAAIWALIVSGSCVLGLFVLWQARNRNEPLVPLGLFRDRNFSLANVAISVMGFAITALAIPIMIWAQVVRGPEPDPGGADPGADGGDDDRRSPSRSASSPTGCTRGR